MYFTRSTDQGTHWSRPTALLEFAGSSPALPTVLDVVTAVEDPSAPSTPSTSSGTSSGQAHLHVLFYDPYQTGIYYASSADAGATWSRAEMLDSQERGNQRQGPAWPALGLDRQGNLVALWMASHDQISCARYSRSSNDGGKSWSPRQHVLAPMQGCFWRSALATDSAGILHMFSAARDDGGLVHLWQSAWTGKDWQPPAVFTSMAVPDGPEYFKSGWDRLQVALTEGNKFHLTWFSNDGKIWYMRGDGSSPATPLLPQPTFTPVPTISPTPAALAAVAPTRRPSPAPSADSVGGPAPNETPGTAIFAGLIPVVVLLIVVVAVRVRGR